MTTEAAQQPDLITLPIRDLAKRAQEGLKTIEQEVENKEQIIPRALSRIDLIDQIRSEPAVHAFLKNAGRSVRVVGRGHFNSNRRLSVSDAGYELGWTQPTGTESAFQHESHFDDINESVMTDLYNGQVFLDSHGLDKKFVTDLAKLQPKQIIEYFREALSKPVEL